MTKPTRRDEGNHFSSSNGKLPLHCHLVMLAWLSLASGALGLMPAARRGLASEARGVRMSGVPNAPAGTHTTVIFLRHGQSVWNAASLFTGWADVELSTLGKNEAAAAATDMWREGIKVDVGYCSRLKRAKQTMEIALEITGQSDVPVNYCWRLNERMYGGLTGLNKVETAEKYGTEQVKLWRRSYDVPPPDVELDSEYWPGNDDEYIHIPVEDIPRAECLRDCVMRTLPYWFSDITPALRRGKTVLIAAHGNSIRGMLKHLDDISDEDILSVEVPTAIPLVYHLDKDLKPIASDRSPDGPLTGYFLREATIENDPQLSYSVVGPKAKVA